MTDAKIRKPVVDKERCAACGVCESICPAVFKVNEENKSEVLAEADFAANQKAIKQAIDSCPTEAISWEE